GVKFVSRSRRTTLAREQNAAVITLRQSKDARSIALQFAGANGSAPLDGTDALPGTANYLIGSDASKWRTKLPTYGSVRAHDVYPGIDVTYYGREQQFEYDFLVAPGADPNRIRLRAQGVQRMWIDAAGDRNLETGAGPVT